MNEKETKVRYKKSDKVKLKKDGSLSYQGEFGGQPIKWNNADELVEYVEEFFNWCDENEKRPTVTRLAYYLNCDRQTLLNYENCESNGWLKRLSDEERKKYVGTIKKAKMKIEAEYEDSLFTKSETVGAIFTLKNNYNWKDRQEVVNVEDNNINVDLEDVNKELEKLE